MKTREIKRKLKKLRNYWVNKSFESCESSDFAIIEANDVINDAANEYISLKTAAEFCSCKRKRQRLWKLIFIDFLILSEK